jgi:hypothetical protein
MRVRCNRGDKNIYSYQLKVNEASFVVAFRIFVFCPYRSSEIKLRFKVWIWNVKYACMLVDSGSIIFLFFLPCILEPEVFKPRLKLRSQA